MQRLTLQTDCSRMTTALFCIRSVDLDDHELHPTTALVSSHETLCNAAGNAPGVAGIGMLPRTVGNRPDMSLFWSMLVRIVVDPPIDTDFRETHIST